MCVPTQKTYHRTKLCHTSTRDVQKDVSAAGFLFLPQCGIRWLWLPVKQQGRILLTYLVKAYLWNLPSRACEDTTYNRYSWSMSHINTSNYPFMDFIQLKRAARHSTFCGNVKELQASLYLKEMMKQTTDTIKVSIRVQRNGVDSTAIRKAWWDVPCTEMKQLHKWRPSHQAMIWNPLIVICVHREAGWPRRRWRRTHSSIISQHCLCTGSHGCGRTLGEGRGQFITGLRNQCILISGHHKTHWAFPEARWAKVPHMSWCTGSWYFSYRPSLCVSSFFFSSDASFLLVCVVTRQRCNCMLPTWISVSTDHVPTPACGSYLFQTFYLSPQSCCFPLISQLIVLLLFTSCYRQQTARPPNMS